MLTFYMPLSYCPCCGYKCDMATAVNGKNRPESGQWTMCFACGALLVFDDEMLLRRPTQQELAEAPGIQRQAATVRKRLKQLRVRPILEK